MNYLINKKSVLEACKLILQERMSNSEKAMNSAQESTKSEDKSSAGDKFETGRAMGHLNRDMYAKQLVEAKKDFEKLEKINHNFENKIVSLGALVQTKTKVYFIACGIGRIKVLDFDIMVLSPLSPIAVAMLGKRLKDTFEFNQTKHQIISLS